MGTLWEKTQQTIGKSVIHAMEIRWCSPGCDAGAGTSYLAGSTCVGLPFF